MITTTQLIEFANCATVSDTLLTMVIDTAYAYIEDEILGYKLTITDYDYELEYYDIMGKDRQFIFLKAYNVADLIITVDDVVYTDYLLDDYVVYFKTPIQDGSILNLTYTAGYDDVDYPVIMDFCALQISALMVKELGGNIGITSRTFDGGMNRSYEDTTKFNKFTDKLKVYKIGLI